MGCSNTSFGQDSLATEGPSSTIFSIPMIVNLALRAKLSDKLNGNETRTFAL